MRWRAAEPTRPSSRGRSAWCVASEPTSWTTTRSSASGSRSSHATGPIRNGSSSRCSWPATASTCGAATRRPSGARGSPAKCAATSPGSPSPGCRPAAATRGARSTGSATSVATAPSGPSTTPWRSRSPSASTRRPSSTTSPWRRPGAPTASSSGATRSGAATICRPASARRRTSCSCTSARRRRRAPSASSPTSTAPSPKRSPQAARSRPPRRTSWATTRCSSCRSSR